MKIQTRAGFLLAAMAATALPLFSQGSSDIYLASLSREGDRLVFAAPVKISERTGYNNQPSFPPDGSGVFYSSADGPQTDIFFYSIGEKTNVRLTSTPDSEYSPLVMPGGNEFSVIQLVLAEGPRKGAQPLLAFPLQGGPPRLVYEEGKKIGYHAWIDGDRLAAFVLGEPNTLQLVNLKNGESRTLADSIGRALYKSPWSSEEILFSREGIIKKVNITTNAVEDVIALKGGDFFCPTPEGGLLTAAGAEIFLFQPGRDATWVKVGDFSAFGVTSITRLAVDPQSRWLAFVSNY
jgi:hypothetical protein